jgi:hypothetical protein
LLAFHQDHLLYLFLFHALLQVASDLRKKDKSNKFARFCISQCAEQKAEN